MNDLFATAMGRALDRTRAGDTTAATALVQETLARHGLGAAGNPTARPSGARPLGQMIDSLLNGKGLAEAPSSGPQRPRDLPDGARWEARRHAGTYGARDFRLYIPSPREAPPRALVLMLHGCTQTADDFAAGTRMNALAEDHNLAVVYPEQTRNANQMACWNWFRAEDQVRGRGEPALLAELATAVAVELGFPDGRIYAAGLSAGGAMAAILGRHYPEVFAAVGVHSGLAPGAAKDVSGAYAAMRGQGAPADALADTPVRSIVFHGSADTTVAPANGAAVIAAALGRTPSIESAETRDVGASVTVHRDLAGQPLAEHWTLHGIAHAWSGGAAEGSHTAPGGPDASAEMVRFFLSLDAEDPA